MINSSQTNSPVTLWFYTDFNAGTYNVIHNDPDQNHRAAAWLLVKKTCGSSDKWTNEASRFEKNDDESKLPYYYQNKERFLLILQYSANI
mgnify:CR=1 FL=1